MCGIAGIVGQRWSDRNARVEAMLGLLAHRGPDDQGIHTADSATIGARRLAIIDVRTGHQPIANEDGTVVAVQNGEIYNFAELRADLERAGHRFRTDHSDTEVIPHLYEEYGTDFVSRLRGMFALALWDTARATLLLARDRMGKKPLFYSAHDGGIAFASELQALLSLPISRDIDEPAIGEYLRLGYINAPRTAFTKIRRIRPAHALVFSSERLIESRYWRLSFTPKTQVRSEEEAIEGLRTRLAEAVRLRLISDVPLGVFLSGGIDSSAVVAFASAASTTPVRTFSVGFNEKAYSELRFARLVAERFGTDHHELIVDASASDAFPMLVRHVGEPFADSSLIPTYLVARAARAHVTVALNGDGGDELFAGYERYRAADIALRVPAPAGVRSAVAWAADRFPVPAWMPAPVRRARRFARVLGLPHIDRYRSWVEYFGDGSPIPADPHRDGSSWAADALLEAAPDDPIDSLLAIDSRTYLPGDLLVKMDIASMAASLEARSPFLDQEVVEYAARLPIGYKLRNGTSKYLLRRLLQPLLPTEVLSRGKQGFSIPADEWLRGPLRPLVTEMLLNGPRCPYVDVAAARTLVREHLDRRSQQSARVWALLTLELWYRMIVEKSA